MVDDAKFGPRWSRIADGHYSILLGDKKIGESRKVATGQGSSVKFTFTPNKATAPTLERRTMRDLKEAIAAGDGGVASKPAAKPKA